MSDAVISVEKLAKRYRIRHLSDQDRQFGYVTLRDVLTAKARKLFQTRSPGPPARSGSEEDFWALNGISFEAKQGERIGVIGRNGAGKSTLLKILSRITDPTSGCVRIKGRVASLLEVGTGFHPELTGRENIFLNGAILGMNRCEIRKKFDEIVAFAEVEKFLDTPVKRFSSGMYVRLAFAVAAHMEPDILIVDEVLAVGDAQFQRKCVERMEEAGRAGRTVIFVSHTMPAVTRLCSRAILLDSGRVSLDGPASTVVSAYWNSGQGTTAVREWPNLETAPGNSVVRLCAVRVFDGTTGHVSDTLDIRHPIQIEIEYLNRTSNSFPYANIQVFDDSGTCLFASGDFVHQGWRHLPRQFTGRVFSRCTIPGNLLSEGRFRVLIGLTTHVPDAVLALDRDAVSFMVIDNSGGDGARGEYSGQFPGVIRPLLDWQVEIDAGNGRAAVPFINSNNPNSLTTTPNHP